MKIEKSHFHFVHSYFGPSVKFWFSVKMTMKSSNRYARFYQLFVYNYSNKSTANLDKSWRESRPAFAKMSDVAVQEGQDAEKQVKLMDLLSMDLAEKVSK